MLEKCLVDFLWIETHLFRCCLNSFLLILSEFFRKLFLSLLVVWIALLSYLEPEGVWFFLEVFFYKGNTARKSSKCGIFSGPYFTAFVLYTERYSASLRIQSWCGKIRTRKISVVGHFSRSENLSLLFWKLLISIWIRRRTREICTFQIRSELCLIKLFIIWNGKQKVS